jgi:hypothetical protein
LVAIDAYSGAQLPQATDREEDGNPATRSGVAVGGSCRDVARQKVQGYDLARDRNGRILLWDGDCGESNLYGFDADLSLLFAAEIPHVARESRLLFGTDGTLYLSDTNPGRRLRAIVSSPNECASAQTLETIRIGETRKIRGSLSNEGDEDWFAVNFTRADDCNFGPSVSLLAETEPVSMQVSASACGGTGLLCREGGDSTSDLTSWAFGYSATCDAMTKDGVMANHRFRQRGEFIQDVPNTIHVRVHATGSSATRMPYTLTLSNGAAQQPDVGAAAPTSNESAGGS